MRTAYHSLSQLLHSFLFVLHSLMNTDPCGGADNEGDGCGVVFPNMAHGGLHCSLCKKLKVAGLTTMAKAELLVPC